MMNFKKRYEEIFHEHYAPLCHYAAKIVNDFDVAEEIVQDLFVQFLEKRSLENVVHLDRFLLRSVKFRCIDLLRKQHNSTFVSFDTLTEHSVPESTADTEEEIEAIFSYMVAKLPAKTREVFLLVRQTGLSYKEAAAHLNISEKTVENQMGRALKMLRVLLKESGYMPCLILHFL